MIAEGILIGGYSQEIFDKNPELGRKKGYLYYLKIGDHYKIGITIALNRRISGLKNKSKEEVVLIDSLETTVYNAWKLEQEILFDFHLDRVYLPWSTELFATNILKGRQLKDFLPG